MLAGVAPANAEPPSVTISASATAGAAPLTVTFEARGDAASYGWQLGNGQTAEGPIASAIYGPGLWTVTVTATAADGATTQASVTVRSVAVTLLPPPESRYGRPVVFQGRVVPALAGEPVALYVGGREVAAALADADGTFELRLPRVRTPGAYEARTPVAASAPVALRLHPVLRATFVGARAVGGRLALTARVWPAAAGTISIRLYRDGRLVRNARAGAGQRVGSRPRCSPAPSASATRSTGSMTSPTRAGRCPGGQGSRKLWPRRRSRAPVPFSATQCSPPWRLPPSEGSARRC